MQCFILGVILSYEQFLILLRRISITIKFYTRRNICQEFLISLPERWIESD